MRSTPWLAAAALAACAPAEDDSGAPPAAALAADVAITDVLLAQSTGLWLAQGGQTVTAREAPVVADRPGTLRVSLSAEAGDGRTVRVQAQAVGVQGGVVTVAEAEAPAASGTVDLWVPGAAFVPGAALSVRVVEASPDAAGGPAEGARWPAEGFVDLDARVVPPLQLVLVPLTVEGEGPTLTQAHLDAYEAALLGWFPTAAVELAVSDVPLERGRSVVSSADLADEVYQLGQRRMADGAEDAVIYFGLFDASRETGLAGGTDFDPGLRAGVGPGPDSDDSAEVMAHELGHLLGALHAPGCGADSIDPTFPREDGTVGVPTLDPRTGAWLPEDRSDLMTYCADIAVSPATTRQLYTGLTYWEGP